MRLSDFLETTYRPLRLRGGSPRSVMLHESAIRSFSRWLGRPATLADFDDLVMARFLEARSAKISPHSVERERCSLLAKWRLACDRGLVQLRPTVMPTKLPERIPHAWTLEELHRLFAAASRAKGFVGPVPAATWFSAVLTLAWESGERIGAILAAQAVDLQTSTLLISGESRKGGRCDRLYNLSAGCVALLHASAAPGRSELLWWPLSTPSLYSAFHKILTAAGLRGRRIGFHQIRRSAASHLAAAGGDATEFLGHSDSKTTRRHYLDQRVMPAGIPAHQRLPRLAASPGQEGGAVS